MPFRKAIASLWPLAALAVIAAVLFRFPPDRYSIYPACPIRTLTGLLCPGCGATHAVAALLRGNLTQAFHDNALIVLYLPAGAAYAFRSRTRTQSQPLSLQVSSVVMLGLIVAGFTLFRNL